MSNFSPVPGDVPKAKSHSCTAVTWLFFSVPLIMNFIGHRYDKKFELPYCTRAITLTIDWVTRFKSTNFEERILPDGWKFYSLLDGDWFGLEFLSSMHLRQVECWLVIGDLWLQNFCLLSVSSLHIQIFSCREIMWS